MLCCCGYLSRGPLIRHYYYYYLLIISTSLVFVFFPTAVAHLKGAVVQSVLRCPWTCFRGKRGRRHASEHRMGGKGKVFIAGGAQQLVRSPAAHTVPHNLCSGGILGLMSRPGTHDIRGCIVAQHVVHYAEHLLCEGLHGGGVGVGASQRSARELQGDDLGTVGGAPLLRR